jgi:UDP-4-amino-4,6-dideoxy-N-acetyl-beta-L-altrosamine N-acetyltransferase
MNTGISFKCVQESDAKLTLKWRSDREISRYMFTDINNVTVEDQINWIKSKQKSETYKHFIMNYDDEPFGYLSFTDIDHQNKHCSSASYIGRKDVQKKLGGVLHNYITDYIFFKLGMNKTFVEIMAGNKNVLKIQRLLKLRHVGTMEQHIFKYDQFHDVEVFELLKSDYMHHPRLQSVEKSLSAFQEERITDA